PAATPQFDADPPALISFPTRRSSDLSTRSRSVHDGRAGDRVRRDHARFVVGTKLGVDVAVHRITRVRPPVVGVGPVLDPLDAGPDRKSTRLNSSHRTTSYAVFSLTKT